MKTNIVIDISTPIPFLAKFWSSSYGPKYCKSTKLQDSSKCNISRKYLMINFYIWHADKHSTILLVVHNQVCPKYPK